MDDGVAKTAGRGRTKRFLIGYFVAYAVVAGLINVFLGPPGMSNKFLNNYRDDYDRYLEIVKSTPYKKWEQRPALNPPDEVLRAQIDFVEGFSALPAFQEEEDRRSLYRNLLDFFNVFMVVVLAVRFGRDPLLGFLDGLVGKVKATLDGASSSRDMARGRREAAETNMKRLLEEKARVEAQTAERVDEMRGEMRQTTEKSLELLERETRDRVEHEQAVALHAMKQALVDEAIRALIERAKAHGAPEEDAALVEEFVAQLEKSS